MFRKIEDAIFAWKGHRESTLKLFKALTDSSLNQSIAADHRTIGRICWHIIATIPEMMSHTGMKLEINGNWESLPENLNVEMIIEQYSKVTQQLLDYLSTHWTDETLTLTDNLYGEQWPRGLTLHILLAHEIHHLGQLTVLMRQAGLTIPGLYGPAKEEWAAYQRPAPEV